MQKGFKGWIESHILFRRNKQSESIKKEWLLVFKKKDGEELTIGPLSEEDGTKHLEFHKKALKNKEKEWIEFSNGMVRKDDMSYIILNKTK